MRLLVARCSVDYTGRLSAHLPEALRLIIVKADGSVLVVSDVTHAMDFDAAQLEKDGVEADLQVALAAAPDRCGEGFRLVRREWPTDIGPVDLMCRDGA